MATNSDPFDDPVRLTLTGLSHYGEGLRREFADVVLWRCHRGGTLEQLGPDVHAALAKVATAADGLAAAARGRLAELDEPEKT